MKNTFEEVSEAKEFLEKNGYFTETLWSINDVMDKYKCTKEEAQKVLKNALNNEATYDQIWLAIDIASEDLKLTKIKD